VADNWAKCFILTHVIDIQMYVLDPSIGHLQNTCNRSKGDLMDFETVYDFGKKVDVLTFEIELILRFLKLEKKDWLSFT
jgi:5-(carboxyamino)imidazole ribonucleotide synthase